MLDFRKHISNVCKLCYYDLHRISAIRHFLTTNATTVLTCAFVLSRLDYCNSLLATIPQYLVHKLQRVQNHAARLVLQVSKRRSVSPLLQTLHWLPITKRIDHKVSSLCYASLNDLAPKYLTDVVENYIPNRVLRSSSQRKILPPKFKLKTGGERSFSFQGAKTWNSLPLTITTCSSLPSFKSNLKTHYFKQSFS